MEMNKMRTGTPNLTEVFPAKSERNNKIDPINKMFSVVTVMHAFFSKQQKKYDCLAFLVFKLIGYHY
jgi:ATP-dependent Clp protease adapter protein ClpS